MNTNLSFSPLRENFSRQTRVTWKRREICGITASRRGEVENIHLCVQSPGKKPAIEHGSTSGSAVQSTGVTKQEAQGMGQASQFRYWHPIAEEVLRTSADRIVTFCFPNSVNCYRSHLCKLASGSFLPIMQLYQCKRGIVETAC